MRLPKLEGVKWRTSVLAASLFAASSIASPASQRDRTSYEAQYGTPQDVTLDDLTIGVVRYHNAAVRVAGNLDISPYANGSPAASFALRKGGAWVYLAPLKSGDDRLETDFLGWIGREVTVTGLFMERGVNPAVPTTSSSPPEGTLRYWRIEGPAEKRTKDEFPTADRRSMKALVEQSEDGAIVRVVGQFRGRNLYGDLPLDSQRKSGDWVIKSEAYAAWVTGRKPKGDGFDLDVEVKSDTVRWLEVVGRVRLRNGVVYIEALQLTLTRPDQLKGGGED